jgi:hypothetical protein
MASHLVLLLLAVVVLLCAVCQGRELLVLSAKCSKKGNYADGSQFKKNLDELLDTMSGAAATSGWFNTSTVGTGGDQVFGLIMCYADRNATECLDCLDGAPERAMELCRGSRNVSVAYDACLLRYSYTRFFAAADFSYDADRSIDVSLLPPYPQGHATDVETMVAVRVATDAKARGQGRRRHWATLQRQPAVQGHGAGHGRHKRAGAVHAGPGAK